LWLAQTVARPVKELLQAVNEAEVCPAGTVTPVARESGPDLLSDTKTPFP
jgi:hypothetical protein